MPMSNDEVIKPGSQANPWKASVGREKIFKTPQDLLDACVEYFEWVHDNPLVMAKPFSGEGRSWNHGVPMMRAMTQKGLYNFLGIGQHTWSDYKLKHGPDYAAVVERVESVIYQQKFEGAAAGLLNPLIIARELGLSDKQEHTSPDGSMSPKDVDKTLVSALVKKLTE